MCTHCIFNVLFLFDIIFKLKYFIKIFTRLVLQYIRGGDFILIMGTKRGKCRGNCMSPGTWTGVDEVLGKMRVNAPDPS